MFHLTNKFNSAVDDLMAHLSISVDSQDSDSVRKLDNLMDVDQLKGDFNKASEDLYDSECHNKYVDSLKTEVNKDFIISESPVKDCIDEVKETYVNAGIDNLVEPSAMCLNKTQADEDIISQFSADLNLSLDENSSLQEHSKETDTTDVKDICIDEGLPIKEKIYLVEDEEFGYKNTNLETECRIPVSLKSSTDLERGKDFNSSESIVPVKPHESTNETKKLVLRDFLKEKVVETLSTRDTAGDDSQLKSSAWNRCINEQDMTSTETEVPLETLITTLCIFCLKCRASPSNLPHFRWVPANQEVQLPKKQLMRAKWNLHKKR